MNAAGFDPVTITLFLGGIALLPLLMVITTSFLKISVVLLMVRNAMGIQQIPPNMVVYGMALALTIFIMAPVIKQVGEHITELKTENVDKSTIVDSVLQASEPMKAFMLKQSSSDIQHTFLESAKQMWPSELVNSTKLDDFIILIPSFVVSELQKGFEIGFLIYVPFIVIDLIVSNILLALGMQMVAPMTVSLPLKVLLFVLVEGWNKLLQNLVLSYA
ncbi:type III secretion system export apparatus subunit SctR [Endozoicomonas sp. SM1973]|uniref:Type III secretion system export apparatus subunit SctR n=1 Tax=Spartinivicinus marinus TaxID=2994442 RepID=A0A853I9F2_9GAMM|nr:type III secretion system export apparatus subunit SctR [Spartinivicinus marinus]MCX4028148.1 type III secretion system export apparatus subunit SctR [Spartinivicinus marinus]NYZ66177.1 type III secretion system export apparatus subunit SctR [Spartinivicinus marinus]